MQICDKMWGYDTDMLLQVAKREKKLIDLKDYTVALTHLNTFSFLDFQLLIQQTIDPLLIPLILFSQLFHIVHRR